jgi:L-alanine-DL-glutamate epimerase-like enolase superfamily enzyme
MAEMYKRHFVPHHSMSGIGLAGVFHLACTFPGYTWLEMMYEPRTGTIKAYQQLGGILESKIWSDEVGYVDTPNPPELGVILNEEKIARYTM